MCNVTKEEQLQGVGTVFPHRGKQALEHINQCGTFLHTFVLSGEVHIV